MSDNVFAIIWMLGWTGLFTIGMLSNAVRMEKLRDTNAILKQIGRILWLGVVLLAGNIIGIALILANNAS